jgi:voltage-gated potassium channel
VDIRSGLAPVRTFLGLEGAPRRRGRLIADAPNSSLSRIRVAILGLVVVVAIGTIGYIALGFTLLEAVYQTVTTVATVGFREVHPLSPVGQVFTIGLIILGAGTVLYNLGLLVEAFTEGHLRQHLERRRMDREIERMRGHVIICGFGRVGRAAAERLLATGEDVVVVDRDETRLAGVETAYLVGDVTGDEVLLRAGIHHAKALIATLENDADTVYLTLSARALAPDLVIVARARTVDSKEKLLLAGATRAVNPQMMGGRRLATFALQPHVTDFIDLAMHDQNLDFQISEVEVVPGSPYDGRTLADLDLAGRTGANLLALRQPGAQEFTPSPSLSTTLSAGAVLILFGSRRQTADLVRLLGP